MPKKKRTWWKIDGRPRKNTSLAIFFLYAAPHTWKIQAMPSSKPAPDLALQP